MNGTTAWILMVVFVTPTGDEPPVETRYETQAQCIAAAEAFVAQHPEFEFQGPDPESVMHPVLRPYVVCKPAVGDESN